MQNLAALKDGNFCYLENIEKIDEAFGSVLGGLLNTVARNLELNI